MLGETWQQVAEWGVETMTNLENLVFEPEVRLNERAKHASERNGSFWAEELQGCGPH